MPPKRSLSSGSPVPRREAAEDVEGDKLGQPRRENEALHIDDDDSEDGEGAPLMDSGGGDSADAVAAGAGGGTLTEEMRALLPIAGQTVLSMLINGLTQQVTIFFVGHIGVVELGAAA